MKRRFATRVSIGAAVAALLLTGCTATPAPEDSGQGAGPEDSRPTASELNTLREDGTLPKTFPEDAENVRLIRDGDKIAASWTGEPLAGECAPSTDSPAPYAALLLLMDVGLEDVEQCGDVWQATQADGSHVFWNTSR